MKTRLEEAQEITSKNCEQEGKVPDSVMSSSFSTQHTFGLVDLRNFKYLDMEGIEIFMEFFFKHMISKRNGFDPASVGGTGFYLDTRPKFYKAIMRRLGVDTTKKITFREFADLLKPCPTKTMLARFDTGVNANRE